MFSRIFPPAPIKSSTGSTPYRRRSQKCLSFHASSQMVSATGLPAIVMTLLVIGRCEVAHLVEDIVGGQQSLRLHEGDLAIAQQRRGIQHRLAGRGLRRRHQSADDARCPCVSRAMFSAACQLSLDER